MNFFSKRRRGSVDSGAQSNTGSARNHILSNDDRTSMASGASGNTHQRELSGGAELYRPGSILSARHHDTLSRAKSPGTVSLSVNYLPSKFSTALLHPNSSRKRKNGKGDDDLMPKRGGGVEAFRSGEARMPREGDEDYDGVVSGGLFNWKGSNLRWNKFKWIMFVANTIFTIYTLVALIFLLLTWFDVWFHADIIRVGNRSELVLSTLAAAVGLITSMIGWAGILLNNRPFLAVYTFLLWICFILLVIPGYITYKQHTFNLQGKINSQWSRGLGDDGRLRIQNSLGCCGYFSPFVEATVSQTCYARSILPGCKAQYLQFERFALRKWYTVSFAIVPLQIAMIVIGLLCSNHVTYRFGKGMMPKAYRLSHTSMAVIMDNYATQLAEQYGDDMASEILRQSKSSIALDVPSIPYEDHAGGGGGRGGRGGGGRYDSIGSTGSRY